METGYGSLAQRPEQTLSYTLEADRLILNMKPLTVELRAMSDWIMEASYLMADDKPQVSYGTIDSHYSDVQGSQEKNDGYLVSGKFDSVDFFHHTNYRNYQ